MKTKSEYLRSGNAPDVIFVELQHPAGTERFWSGLGFFEWNGFTWTGVGTLGAVTMAPNDTEVAVNDVTFTLSGVSIDHLAGLDTRVAGAKAYVWKAWLDESWKVAYSELIEECELDQQSVEVKDGTAEITITGNGGFYFIERQSTAVWDPQNQKNRLISLGIDPTTDTGFDLMHEMKNKSEGWLP